MTARALSLKLCYVWRRSIYLRYFDDIEHSAFVLFVVGGDGSCACGTLNSGAFGVI